MTWVTSLYETYENCSSLIGKSESESWLPLLPICHMVQRTLIEIRLDIDGNLQSVDVGADENETMIIIPCTIESEARSSGNSPHPLCENLKYLSGDFSNIKNKAKNFHSHYIENLQKWCNSKYSHPKSEAVLAYINKETILTDIKSKNGKLYEKISKKPQDYYVRFSVFEGNEPRTWEDQSLRQSFIDYYLNEVVSKQKVTLCYASGKTLPLSRITPRAVRSPGDGTYLISENNTDFIYNGRLNTREEAAPIGYDVSQKVHKALRWLIGKQGYKNGDLVYVTWAIRNELIPQITDPDNIYAQCLSDDADTAEVFADRMRKALAGYRQKLDPDSKIVIMGLDSTNENKGRLSIIYYQELMGSEFLNRVIHWYETSKWYPMAFRIKSDEKDDEQVIKIVGCPTPSDIFFAAYGKETESTKKLKKSTIQRIMPCITEGKLIPKDLVYSSANRAAKLIFAGKGDWAAEKTLNTACSIIRKYENDCRPENKRNDFEHYNEEWKMTLDETQTDRNYLFGRLLAYAREIERFSIFSSGNKPRQTNAERAIIRFRQHPLETWDALYQKLIPYMAKFRMYSPKATGNTLEREMNEIVSSFKTDDFADKPLSPVYLLGYQSQLAKFELERQNKEQNADDENDNTTE